MQPPAREPLSRAQHSAVHLEMRDSYWADTDASGYRDWLDGRRWQAEDRDAWWNGWHDAVSAAVERGVVVRRARIVSEPITDYIRYEYDYAVTNLAAGEDVRWLPRRKATGLAVPTMDFWVFDSELAWLHHFAGDGKLMDREASTDPEIVKLCADAFESVWTRAIPHAEYEPH